MRTGGATRVVIDFLISKAGIRADRVDLSITGVRLAKHSGGLALQSAAEVTGTLRIAFADLTAALARPEVVDQIGASVAGIAKPDIRLTNGPNGGVRLTGSVEFMGRRFPVTASANIHIESNQLVISAGRLSGLPILGALPVQLLDLRLPLAPAAGIHLTGVSTEPDFLVVAFEGHDLQFFDAGDAAP
jgi:hypothetical protein